MDPRPLVARVRDGVPRGLLAVHALLRRTLSDPIAGVVTLVVGLGVAGLMTAVAAKVYDSVTDQEGVAGLDRPVQNWMLALRTPAMNRAMTWLTDLGSTQVLPLLTIVVVLVMTLRRRRWTPVLVMAAAAAGSLMMTIVGKAVVGRKRPPTTDAVAPFEDSYSFPSGHTLNMTVVAGTIAYLVISRSSRRWVRVSAVLVAGLIAVAMGLSRVYLGHHWLTDVLAAWALGLGWLALVVTGHQIHQLRLSPEDATEPDDPTTVPTPDADPERADEVDVDRGGTRFPPQR